MAHLLPFPEVATGSSEAVLSEWMISEGAQIHEGDVLAVIETDKASVELEAQEAGVFLRALVTPNSTVEVGSPIALIGSSEEASIDVDAELKRLGVGASGGAAPEPVTSDPPDTLGVPSPIQDGDDEGGVDEAEADPGRRIFITPLARRMAAAAGLDIRKLRGSGPNGRITKRDVEAAVAAPVEEPVLASSVSPAVVTQARPSPAPVGGGPVGASYEDIPHTRMRRAIARRLTESKQTTPHFYLKASCRVDALLELRAQVNAASDVKISVNDFIVKAAAKAQQRVPEMNAVWGEDAVRRFHTVDVAVAVSTDTGLVTPVLRDVANMSVSALARATAEAAGRAREGRLSQDELDGGALTVTNLGMFGVEEFAAIINPPQAAILAVGAARKEAVVVEADLTVATIVRVIVSVDHRTVDGVVGARWLRSFVELVENPLAILT